MCTYMCLYTHMVFFFRSPFYVYEKNRITRSRFSPRLFIDEFDSIVVKKMVFFLDEESEERTFLDSVFSLERVYGGS